MNVFGLVVGLPHPSPVLPMDIQVATAREMRLLRMLGVGISGVLATTAYVISFLGLPPEIAGAILAAGAAMIGVLSWQLQKMVRTIVSLWMRGWIRNYAEDHGLDPEEEIARWEASDKRR